MAFGYDVVVVGTGPAGLSAATQLGRAGRRTLVLEKELFGGALQHTGLIDDYPAFPDGITGADLAGKFIAQATASGATIEQADVTGVELFSRSRWVACSDGRGFSCGLVILAAGTHFTRLGLPNEDKFRGRGVVDCTPCDGGFFVDRDVVVYGSSEYALRDAAYLEELGCRVTLLAPDNAHLQEIVGDDRLEGVVVSKNGARERLAAAGLFVRVGVEPSSAPFEEVVDLDEQGFIVANDDLETSAQWVLACGDVRAGATKSVQAAIADGERAAARAAKMLGELEQG